jgi:heme O synthase-like polyprenyltransferase
LYAGFFAALIWNDITDSEIDGIAHPDRPIPSGKISKKRFFAIALVFSAMVFQEQGSDKTVINKTFVNIFTTQFHDL